MWGVVRWVIVVLCGFVEGKKKENRGITIAILWLDSFEGEGWVVDKL